MAQDGVLYAFSGSCCIIRLVGVVKYSTIATEFEHFVESLVDRKEIQDVVIDVRACTYIDSTDLGILARIAISQGQKGAPKPVILHGENSDIALILKDVGFGRVFTMVDMIALKECDFSLLESTVVNDELTMARMMVQAHQCLVDLDDSNQEKFSAVISLLEKNISDMEKQKGDGSEG